MNQIHDHPRVTLLRQETPIEPLARLSAKWDIDLFIKRDDIAGAPFGGNKSRQLEFYLGAAQRANADTVLITGAVQSNFVRTTAAAAASLGMHTIVQLENRVPDTDERYQRSGNVLLLDILGAEVMHYPVGEDEAGADRALRARADELRNQGKRPYVIPLALGNPPLGALGYVRAGYEIVAQDPDFDVVVVASGSGLTHAGLLAGVRGAGSKARVIGSCVRRPQVQQRLRIQTVLKALSELTDDASHITENDIVIWDGALAPGYGQLGPQASNAMQTMARNEGVFLDPVYTAKGFAAIPALVESGEIPKGARVLFVHTGGLASLFAYEDPLKRAFGAQ